MRHQWELRSSFYYRITSEEILFLFIKRGGNALQRGCIQLPLRDFQPQQIFQKSIESLIALVLVVAVESTVCDASWLVGSVMEPYAFRHLLLWSKLISKETLMINDLKTSSVFMGPLICLPLKKFPVNLNLLHMQCLSINENTRFSPYAVQKSSCCCWYDAAIFIFKPDLILNQLPRGKRWSLLPLLYTCISWWKPL